MQVQVSLSPFGASPQCGSQPLIAAENRVYTPPEGVDGFNLVTVNVEIPQHSPRCDQTSTFGWDVLQLDWGFDDVIPTA